MTQEQIREFNRGSASLGTPSMRMAQDQRWSAGSVAEMVGEGIVPGPDRMQLLRWRIRFWRERIGFWIAGYDPLGDLYDD